MSGSFEEKLDRGGRCGRVSAVGQPARRDRIQGEGERNPRAAPDGNGGQTDHDERQEQAGEGSWPDERPMRALERSQGLETDAPEDTDQQQNARRDDRKPCASDTSQVRFNQPLKAEGRGDRRRKAPRRTAPSRCPNSVEERKVADPVEGRHPEVLEEQPGRDGTEEDQWSPHRWL